MTQLLSSSQSKKAIEELYNTSDLKLFLSAYFTKSALDWMSELSVNEKIKLVIRATPRDFLSGASDIVAVREGLDFGWDIRFISALHAKVYLFDSVMLVGSGNLTANGMHLKENSNLELNTIVEADPGDIKLLHDVYDNAQKFSEKILDAMEKWLEETGGEEKEYLTWWPKEVLPIEERRLFCSDFPQTQILEFDDDGSFWGRIAMCSRGENEKEVKPMIESSNAYQWLYRNIKDKDRGLSFGALGASLHNELVEDPKPYRSSVKELLANLLSFIEEIDNLDLEVIRPNYSQVLRLKK